MSHNLFSFFSERKGRSGNDPRRQLKTFLACLLFFSLALSIVPAISIRSPIFTVSAQESPSITVNLLSDFPSTPWGDAIQAYGTVTGSESGDNVTIGWGDGTTQTGIPLDINSNWGLVSHIYSSESVGSREIVVRLLRSVEEVANNTLAVQVLKRSTFTSLNPVSDVIQGQNITVSGALYDAGQGLPLQNIQLSFGGSGVLNGTGHSNLPNAVSDENGQFVSTGHSPDIVDDALVVQVTLGNATNNYDDPFGNIVTYDTISNSAVSYNVQDGPSIPLNMKQFDATLAFEQITTSGDLTVYNCTAAQNPRYRDPFQIGVCLNVRPSIGSSFAMADGSIANLTLSVAGVNIPSGYSFSDLHMFRLDRDNVADITIKRNQTNSQITGQTLSFSKFIIAIPDFPPQVKHSLRVPIVLGNNNVEFGNLNSQANNSAIFEITPTTLSVGSSATLKITDSDGNIDPKLMDDVTASLYSDTSTATGGITLELEETGTNTAIFTAIFTITSGASSGNQLHAQAGDKIFVGYNQSIGRLKALLEGVTEAGIAEAAQYMVDPTQVTFMPIGGAVDMQLVGAQLGSEGKVNVTVSYANAITHGQNPLSFRLFHLEGGIWQDITLPDGVDNVTKTVSGQTTSLSPFSIGVDVGVPGGAGGGGFTGRGIVVDAVASIVKSSGGSSHSGSSGTAPTSQTSVQSGRLVSAIARISATSDYSGGAIGLSFENVISPGNIEVTEKSISSLPSGALIATDSKHASATSVDGGSFNMAGPVFDIKTTPGFAFEGMVEITMPYSETFLSTVTNHTGAENNIRLLHFDGSGWQDITTRIDSSANTVSGKVSSFSPLVAAIVQDGTFSSRYFDQNPLSKIIMGKGSSPISSDASSTGITFIDSKTGSKVTSIEPGSKIAITSSIKNNQRVAQQYSYIVEIIDPEGVVIDIKILTGTVEKGNAKNLETEWSASIQPGKYMAKIFVIDDISEKGSAFVLTRASQSNISVVSHQ